MGRFNSKTQEVIQLNQAESGCYIFGRDHVAEGPLDYGDDSVLQSVDALQRVFDTSDTMSVIHGSESTARMLASVAVKDYGIDVMLLDPVTATFDEASLKKTKRQVDLYHRTTPLCIVDFTNTQDSDIHDDNVRALLQCIGNFVPLYSGKIASIETPESLTVRSATGITDSLADSEYLYV